MSSEDKSQPQLTNGGVDSDDVEKPEENNTGDDIVTPWTVSATNSKGIDYDKLIGITFNFYHIIF